jgi:hypothetical protein
VLMAGEDDKGGCGGNLCDYMRYMTDFSSEIFVMYVGIIYTSTSHLPSPPFPPNDKGKVVRC